MPDLTQSEPSPDVRATRERLEIKIRAIGHTDSVRSVAWSPDGTRALSAADDGTVRLWEVDSGRCLRVLEGHTGSVVSVAWSPDGTHALSGAYDRTVRLWEVASGRCLRVFEGHTDIVSSVAWSPDGTRALSAAHDWTVRLWDLASGRCLRVFEGHTDIVSSVAWSPDGTRALSAAHDWTVRLWDLASGRCLHVLDGHTDIVSSVAWSPDGTRALSAARDRTLRLWDLASGRCLRVLEGHTASALSIVWSPDGTRALSGAYDRTVRLWEVASGRCLHVLDGHTDSVRSVAWSPDGTRALSAAHDWTVRLWDLASGRCLHVLDGHTDSVRSVAWSPDGSRALSAAHDWTVRLWEVDSGRCLHVLDGHTASVWSVAWSPDGTRALSAGYDTTVRLWDVDSGRCLHVLEGHRGPIWSVAWSPDGKHALSAAEDRTVRLWDVDSGRCLRILEGHTDSVWSVAWSPDGTRALSGAHDRTVRLWDLASGRCLRVLEGHTDSVWSVAWSPDGTRALSGSHDKTIRLWDVHSGRCLRILEGHTDSVWSVAWSPDGQRALSGAHDRTVRLWDVDSGRCLRVLIGHTGSVGSAAWSLDGRRVYSAAADGVIAAWVLTSPASLAETAAPSVSYTCAKVVLVGDTGVGKSGLSLVLNGQPFAATDSTPGRRVWTLDTRTVPVGENLTQVRETLLWDLAGQPGYRIIHQLHLHEVAVALVIFDARSETDPLAGVRHWERALDLACQRQGTSALPMKKFLVSARSDRGGVSVSKERFDALIAEFRFDAHFETSAKEGWQIAELRAAIDQAVVWEALPPVSSSQLFADIKAFLVELKKTGRLLALPDQIHDDFVRHHPDTAKTVPDLRAQVETCIGRLEARDLIRRLTFGGYVLLQPELLDAYASAMVNAAKEEPDGLGSLAEEAALAGKFFVPSEQKITDSGQAQLLLHATVEELVRHDLALRENADDGRYLVFPSQFNRDYEDAPEPKGKAVAITFDGPVQSLYSTLAVRLGHSGLFTTGRAEMWRNAAEFAAKAGGKCGLFVSEFSEGRGRLVLFFDAPASPQTRFHFEEFVLAHTKRRALDGSVELVRFFVCPSCGDPVPDSYVKRLKERGVMLFNCPCGGNVPLADSKQRLSFRSEVAAMDRSADRRRDFDAFLLSAKGETSTKSFQEWAGGERVTLAIVFTDVVGSTALGEEIRDEPMNEVRRAHFTQSRRLIGNLQGREIKTIGDSFMAAFKSADGALDYALALQKDTGHPAVRIRAGIHIGPMQVEEGDVFGGTVNFAARVVGAIEDKEEIWLSDRAKADVDSLRAKRHQGLQWHQQLDEKNEGFKLKGFSGTFTLWSVSR